MDMLNPALMNAYFYPAGDRGSEYLWQAVAQAQSAGQSRVRQQRLIIDGVTVVQVILEREGPWAAAVWQQLAQEMAELLGQLDPPPGRPWGMSQYYLGALVAGPYEEQNLLRQGLGLPAGPTHPPAPLPAGRLWLISPPLMREGGISVARYAWIHAPSEGARQQVQVLLWGENALLLRAELYLHRSLHSLRLYGRHERAAFWTALEQLEVAATTALEQPGDHRRAQNLRLACSKTIRGLSHLNRRHNLLRSSAYLYRQISSKLVTDEGTLFSWYTERLNEAIVQWSYDLERADRALSLAQTAVLAMPSPPATTSPPSGLPWPAYLVAGAVIALCLVDASWTIVVARAVVMTVLALVLWGWAVLRERKRWPVREVPPPKEEAGGEI